MSIDLSYLSMMAIKAKDANDKEFLFSLIESIERLQEKLKELEQENRELRSCGAKTHAERKREVEDEIYFRNHGNIGMK